MNRNYPGISHEITPDLAHHESLFICEFFKLSECRLSGNPTLQLVSNHSQLGVLSYRCQRHPNTGEIDAIAVQLGFILSQCCLITASCCRIMTCGCPSVSKFLPMVQLDLSMAYLWSKYALSPEETSFPAYNTALLCPLYRNLNTSNLSSKLIRLHTIV